MKILKALLFSSLIFGAIILGVSLTQKDTNTYSLPPLPYAFDALEPHIDAETMRIHYTKHHQAYIDKLNKALDKYPEIKKIPLSDLLKNLETVPEDIRNEVKNNGGGHINHSFFWLIMTPHSTGKPSGELASAIDKNFGGLAAFKEEFSNAAKNRFGSGWAWLCADDSGKLVVISTHDQDSPITLNLTPILGLDVWEHAYYLKYQNKRPDYIAAWWNVVNWNQAEKNYQDFLKLKK